MLLADGRPPENTLQGKDSSNCSIDRAPLIDYKEDSAQHSSAQVHDMDLHGTVIMGFMPSATACRNKGELFTGYNLGARQAIQGLQG